MNYLRNLAVLALLSVGLASCTSGQSAVEPPFQGANIAATSTLQFAPGSATIATAAATSVVGLDVMATLRAPNGLSAALYNTPTITGPAGFVCVCTAPAGNIDNTTNHISGTPPIQVGAAVPASTFGSGTNTGAASGGSSSVGVFGYGLMAANSTVNGSAFFTPQNEPFFATGGVAIRWIGGPPAFPNVRDGTYPAGYRGFTEGFADFQTVPFVAGAYTLADVVPTGFDSNGNATFQTLATTTTALAGAALPIFTRPVFTPNGTGGGTIAYVLPAGVTEAYLQVRNDTAKCYPSTNAATGATAAPVYFTVRVTPGSPNPAVLPDNLGETNPTHPSTHTLCTGAESAAFNAIAGTIGGDNFTTYAAGFDWPAYASAYPQSSGQAAPPIVNASGRADVTTSFPQQLQVYP